MEIEALHPGMSELFPGDAAPERIASGYTWAEGPVWDHRHHRLLFSDIPDNAIWQWSPQSGASLFLQPSGYTGREPFRGREPGSNGLTFDRQGRLVMCQHGDRRVARLAPDGAFETLVDSFQGKRLNSPNDLVYRSNGDLYFTDPAYGLPDTFDDPARELGFCGVYRLDTAGELHAVCLELSRPNGLAFSPDERILYVANSDPERALWRAYDVLPDGGLAHPRVFHDATPLAGKAKGLPDGLKVDRAGNIIATGPGGIFVFSPDAQLLGRVHHPQAIANVALGPGYLFLTATSEVWRIPFTG